MNSLQVNVAHTNINAFKLERQPASTHDVIFEDSTLPLDVARTWASMPAFFF